MATLSAGLKLNRSQRKALQQGASLACLCLACARSEADAPALPAPALPMFARSAPAIPAAFNGLQPHQPGQTTDLMTRLGTDPAVPLSIPLNVQFGRGSGVSFLYNLAAAAPDAKKTAAPRAATYGFSNALAFGHDSLHLNGLMYFGSGPAGDGKLKASQVISQALAFENKGWKLDAHYQSVGKDFSAADTLKSAAPSLGLMSGLTADTASQLTNLRGQNDLGFGLAHADTHGSFNLGYKENDNAVSHLKTTQQSLSLGRSFGHGLQFEAGRTSLSAKSTQGDASKDLTTTTNHLKLGMDGGKGLSFSAEANLLGDTQGRAEQHLAYSLASQAGGTHFAARLQSNSLLAAGSKEGRKSMDQTLGLDMDRQLKGLGLKASFLQFAAVGTDGARQTKTTQHLELALKDTQLAFNLLSTGSRPKDGGKNTGDQTLNLDVTRQTRGLALKASLVQFAPTADNAQAKTTEHLETSWQAHKNLVVAAHWTGSTTQTVGAQASGTPPPGTDGRQETRDLTATLDGLRLHGLRNSKAVLNLAQTVSQGKMQADTRALCFDSDMPDTRVHLEYSGSVLGLDKSRNSLVSRAVRVASIAPGDWLHYSAYYKMRSQTNGGHLADIRNYTVGMRLSHVTLAYHYLNQQEQPDGSVSDTVMSQYQVDGPLTRKLAWNAQYEQTTNRADKSGLEKWLIGVKGDLTPHQSIVLMLGRPELRVDGTTVPGETFKMTFICKMDETDSVALNGEVTNWSRKTKDTPSTVSGNFRLDVNKGF